MSRRVLKIPPGVADDASLGQVFQVLDVDQSGEISILELCAFVAEGGGPAESAPTGVRKESGGEDAWTREALSRGRNEQAAERVRKLLDEVAGAPEDVEEPKGATAKAGRAVPEEGGSGSVSSARLAAASPQRQSPPGGNKKGMRYDDNALQELLQEANRFVRQVAPNPGSVAGNRGGASGGGFGTEGGSRSRAMSGSRQPSAGHFPPPNTAGGLSLQRSLSTPSGFNTLPAVGPDWAPVLGTTSNRASQHLAASGLLPAGGLPEIGGTGGGSGVGAEKLRHRRRIVQCYGEDVRVRG